MTRELERHTAELQAIHDQSPIGVFHTDLDSAQFHCNARLAEISGLPTKSVSTVQWFSVVVPEDRTRVQGSWYEAIAAGAEFDAEFRMQSPGRPIVWVHGKAAPLREGRVLIGYVGTVRDITREREAHLAQERSAAFLQLVIDTAPAQIQAKDEQGRYVVANEAVCRHVGRPISEVIGKTDADLYPSEVLATIGDGTVVPSPRANSWPSSTGPAHSTAPPAGS
ncbi:MAG: PAS domain-containing protein [Burkholderiales bacterium]